MSEKSCQGDKTLFVAAVYHMILRLTKPPRYGGDLAAVYALRFVVLAADAQVARSILLYQSNVDKISHLAEDKALACAGPQSDCVSFTEYVSKNMALYELNNDVKLTTKAAATFIRGEVRESLYKVRVSLTLACPFLCL